MTNVATVAIGLAVWWASACRIGLMNWRTHRPGAILLHWSFGALGLGLAAAGACGLADALALTTAGALAALVLVTLDEWRAGAPDWSRR